MAAVGSSTPCQDYPVCMLCFHDISIPRILPCLHSFCENCLQDHINSTIRDRTTNFITCPACEKKCIPPNVKDSFETWASSFPKDDLTVSLIEFTRETENPDDRCEWCRNEEKCAQAKIWCRECKEKLCDGCQQSHRNHPGRSFKEHRFVPLDTTGALKHTDVEFIFSRNCQCNEGKPIETYCIDDQQMCCVVCSSTTHRHCSDIRKLNVVVTEFVKRATAAKVLSEAEKIMKNVEEFRSKRGETTTKVVKDLANCVEDMKEACDSLRQQIDRFQVQYSQSAEDIRIKVKKNLEKSEKTLQRFTTNVDNSNRILKTLKRYGSPRQQLESYGAIVSQLKTHYQKLKKDLEEESDVIVIQETVDVLKELTATNDGRIKTNSTPSESSNTFVGNMDTVLENMSTKLRISAYGGAQRVRTDSWSFKGMTFLKAVTQVQSGTRGANCVSGVFLDDGRLLMADYQNKRLIEFDVNYDYVKSYKMNDYVEHVDSDGGYIYVVVLRSYDGDQYICQCELKNDLKILREMPGPKRMSGFAVCGEKLVTSTSEGIQILSLSGELISSVKMTGISSNVAVSRRGIIIHRNNDDVVMTSEQGTKQHRYRNPQLQKPTGFCVDGNDIIYVCGMGSQNVHQISPDGSKGRIILDKFHGIKKPMIAIYNNRRDEILISTYSENTVFEIYKLE